MARIDRPAQHQTLPYTPVDHAGRAWSTLVITVGVLVDALQHAAPQIQAVWPQVHWIAPCITSIGFVWLSFQKLATADHQAVITAAQKGRSER